MTYTEFSTKNADYILQLGIHGRENNHSVYRFKGIDALVLENSRFEQISPLAYIDDPQYGHAVNHCIKKEIPIFNTDAESKFNREYLNFFGEFYAIMALGTNLIPTFPLNFLAPASLLLFDWKITKTASLNKDSLGNFSEKIISNKNYLLQNPLVEGRNAINAKKIEEFVAPILKDRLKRRPKIGMIYGAAHAGIKHDLQSRRRNFTLWNWKKLNFSEFSGFDKKNLNKVFEVKYQDKLLYLDYSITEYEFKV